ncbi:HAMP domain-containing histidine kinase [Gordonia sp. HY002]|uniref:sensor histidine kinase n=1 Tax=Gordonia zhenghanii TaxID=2911516 RepID=UPI001EEF8B69|nr:HAMP domain-containing sensor histidine kinase [Gordonia zhenghanii]MCF8570481.1 HAMP domain-containing histidine kinase [Gordonia zhenghanii]MCF8602562.1 HAMP domain-containing histidine kinase [Gordonia zhenghanii]
MARAPGLSVRLKLTLSYASFLVLAGVLLLAAVWVFLLRGRSTAFRFPALADFGRVFDPSNFGPVVFVPAAIIVIGFLLVFGLVGGWILAGRMLAPLTRISNAARKAQGGSLSFRIEMEGRKDEFRELADAFDAMLAQLEIRDAEQQRFAANASHELRTPLAITQTLLDVALNDPDREDSQLDQRLRMVNTRAIELTEALLLLSRVDQRTFDRHQVDLALIADEAIETLLPLAEKHGVAIETDLNPTPCHGSHTLLLQLATNLLHNAIVHNLCDDGRIHIGTATDCVTAQLTFENTGIELDPSVISTLIEPFQRGTERVGGDHVGAGLGLAIANRIAQAHDGDLSLRPHADGGLCSTVRLPATARSSS